MLSILSRFVFFFVYMELKLRPCLNGSLKHERRKKGLTTYVPQRIWGIFLMLRKKPVWPISHMLLQSYLCLTLGDTVT